MAEPEDDRSARFKALKTLVGEQREQLTSDQGVPGTKIGFWDLKSLSDSYGEFEKVCMKQLEKSNSCTGMFNVAGKRLDVEVTIPKADVKADKVLINITNEETGAKRKAVFAARNTNNL